MKPRSKKNGGEEESRETHRLDTLSYIRALSCSLFFFLFSCSCLLSLLGLSFVRSCSARPVRNTLGLCTLSSFADHSLDFLSLACSFVSDQLYTTLKGTQVLLALAMSHGHLNFSLISLSRSILADDYGKKPKSTMRFNGNNKVVWVPAVFNITQYENSHQVHIVNADCWMNANAATRNCTFSPLDPDAKLPFLVVDYSEHELMFRGREMRYDFARRIPIDYIIETGVPGFLPVSVAATKSLRFIIPVFAPDPPLSSSPPPSSLSFSFSSSSSSSTQPVSLTNASADTGGDAATNPTSQQSRNKRWNSMRGLLSVELNESAILSDALGEESYLNRVC